MTSGGSNEISLERSRTRPSGLSRGYRSAGARIVLLAAIAVLPISVAMGQEAGDRSEISIAAEPDYPPYSYVDETGNPTGFSVELFRAVAARMDLDLSVTTDYWATIKDDLAAGRIDALPLVGRTPEREEYFDFTVPYISLYGGIVVRSEDERVRGIGDLTGLRVAVMAGDNAEEFLRRGPIDLEVRTFPTFVDALEDVASGGSDAVVMQRLVAVRILRQEGFTSLKLVDRPLAEFRQDFCFAVAEGDKELLAVLNEGLSLVVADGTFRRLQTEWFASMELPSRTIVVGGDHSYPPFEFLDERGRPTGYNVELVRALAREMGMDIEIRLGPWTDVITMLEHGEIDVISGMMYSTTRDRVFDFAPAHTVHQNVVVGRGRGPRDLPSSIEELRGHSIAVQSGDIMHGLAVEQDLTDQLLVVESQQDTLGLVIAGDADYALGSRLTAMYLIEANGWDELVVGRRSLLSTEYGFAVREGNTALLSYFAEGLAVLEASGEYREIYDRWLGVYAPADFPFRQVFRTVFAILAPVLLVLMTIIAWNRSLRAQVARSTAELQASIQRKQWLNTVATSYLTREDAQSLIRETVSMLDRQFSGLRACFLSSDGTTVTADSSDHADEVPVQSPAVLAPPPTFALFESFDAPELTVVHDTQHDTRTAQHAHRFADHDARAFAVAGVRANGALAGLLGFTATAPRDWSQHELLALEEHANLLTLISENETYQQMLEDANSTLRSSLAEKETLLKEVHHRVKNNLNVIVSLLRLQEDRIDSVESAREAFEQSRNRIFSMALVHESLYHSKNLTDIQLDEYVRSLIEQLQSIGLPNRQIHFRCELEPVTVDIGTAVPCGIIINELISNAHKHAFGDSASGEITVLLERVDATSLVLSVRDDGVGIPESFTTGKATTLGLQLVSLLAEQIDGTLSFTLDRGTRVDLVVPLQADDPEQAP